jgi:hypothetical protein
MLNNLINETLEVICRAMSIPETPETASLRVFIFRNIKQKLICSHFWSPNPVKEHVGRLQFEINEEWANKVAIVRAAISEEVTSEEVITNNQVDLASMKSVSEHISFVLAAPIFNKDGSLWGIVDFDTLNERGKHLLMTDVSNAAIYKLSKYLQLLFSLS